MPHDLLDPGDASSPYPYPYAPRHPDGAPFYSDAFVTDVADAGIVAGRYYASGVMPMLRGDRWQRLGEDDVYRVRYEAPDVPALTADQLAAVIGLPEVDP